MDSTESVKEWLIKVIQGLVSFPDEIEINHSKDDMGVLFTLKCNHSDNGKIIGREGKTALAIRHLLRVHGMIHNVRASLKIDVPEIVKN